MTFYYIDIDGTLAFVEKRYKQAGKEPKRNTKEHVEWLNRIMNKKLMKSEQKIAGMLDLVVSLSFNQNVRVFYLTARDVSFYKETQGWLKSCGFPQHHTIHRTLDFRLLSDSQYKEKRIKYFTPSSKDVMVIDDDPSGNLQKICKKNGWTFLKACSGGTLA